MPIIEVESLTKHYGDRAAVDDVSFSVERGEIFGILGPNGAGKTTTVESIAGLRTPDAGRISVLGLDPRRDAARLRRRVGVQLQESALPPKLRAGEAVGLYASFYDAPADPGALLDELGLAAARDVPYAKLSGGQQQRLSIALALVGDPEIAILDELTTGLDPQARRDTWSLIERIRDRGVTVLLVTHFMDEAERLADRVALIDGGRIVALDTPAALAARAGDAQRIRFRAAEPFTLSILSDLSEVSAVTDHGTQIEVAGSGDLLTAVIGTLAHHGVSAQELQYDRAGLEDAFVALTA
jgi:ABC-2 type transport system ATP-binding protein